MVQLYLSWYAAIGFVLHKLLCKIVCKSNSLAIVLSAEFYFYHPKWKLLQQVRIEIL